jgi:tRNA modification GTPase
VVAGEADNVLVAEDIRRALGALDALVGKTDVEAVLDVVFASFCLGK